MSGKIFLTETRIELILTAVPLLQISVSMVVVSSLLGKSNYKSIQLTSKAILSFNRNLTGNILRTLVFTSNACSIKSPTLLGVDLSTCYSPFSLTPVVSVGNYYLSNAITYLYLCFRAGNSTRSGSFAFLFAVIRLSLSSRKSRKTSKARASWEKRFHVVANVIIM